MRFFDYINKADKLPNLPHSAQSPFYVSAFHPSEAVHHDAS